MPRAAYGVALFGGERLHRYAPDGQLTEVDPETDREGPTGEIGELVVRCKHPWTCSLGYYGMPAKTVEAWRNLWFPHKDALRRRGENISSYEVEQALLGRSDGAGRSLEHLDMVAIGSTI